MVLIFGFFNYVIEFHPINVNTVTFIISYSWSLFRRIEALQTRLFIILVLKDIFVLLSLEMIPY